VDATGLAPAALPPGRRERKKVATREALTAAALELFEAKGVDATTVEEIADAVDVSPRTFHRYFAAKEDVLFADADDRLARFERALAARPAHEPLLDSLRLVVRDLTSHFVENAAFERRRLRVMRSHPGLIARRSRQTDQWREALAAHAAARLGSEPGDPLPALVAACTSAALGTALDRWFDDPRADYVAVVDECFGLLGDLRRATTRPRKAAR
jgi:AcrR family transcriptional regulator